MQLCVATDMSPAAAPAIELAMRWAKTLSASLLLVHVVHDPVVAPALGDDVPGDVSRAKQELEVLAKKSGVPCRVDVRSAEDVASAIVKAANGCDYLILGSHGRSGFQRLRLGSVAAAVLRQCHVPVVCTPPRERAA